MILGSLQKIIRYCHLQDPAKIECVVFADLCEEPCFFSGGKPFHLHTSERKGRSSFLKRVHPFPKVI